ncbi:ring-cleaving dioxygenase [Atopobacter phocae]|uniref:ring-cleaving dioxygenase n=1 Tax=Atopobacter phocae TaxID=136492 RepID=UPI000472A616|nr:ring-cleaving dioxygenase [Atopobacter phocae]
MTQHDVLGIHHVTAVTSDIIENYNFLTDILGIRLLKKSVNQDDIHVYHTYYGDDFGTPGTALTFFDFPNTPQAKKGTNMISRIGLRVPTDAALEYYANRFDEFNVKHDEITEEFGVKVLRFWDNDEQAYQLLSDEHNEGMKPGTPWKDSPVPAEHAIYGLGTVEITVSYFDKFKLILEQLYDMEEIAVDGNRHLFEMGEKGNGARLVIVDDPDSPAGMPGYGDVHHVAFRLADAKSLKIWEEKYNRMVLPHSGYVDRFYFESLYARIGHILFELATDAPGFMVDEPYETMGEILSLPPFLEENREEIERVVRPFNTKRSK